MLLFIAELNVLQSNAINISNAYLEYHTTEKIWIIAPPEFGRHKVYNLLKLFNQLQLAPFNFKLKGSQLIKDAIHLGCKFTQDQHGVL